MMDMMTILLVAFIFQAATSATALTAGTVSLPKSLSDDELPEGASTLIITKTGIVVEGQVDRRGLQRRCRRRRKRGRQPRHQDPAADQLPRRPAPAGGAKRRSKPGDDPAKRCRSCWSSPIAPRPTASSLEVMFSAKQKEAGYKHFRLIVQKSYPLTAK